VSGCDLQFSPSSNNSATLFYTSIPANGIVFHLTALSERADVTGSQKFDLNDI